MRPPPVFSAEGMEKAIRSIQGEEIRYREFCRRIAAAGCVGYLVNLAGHRAVYYGRTEDAHVEWFSNHLTTSQRLTVSQRTTSRQDWRSPSCRERPRADSGLLRQTAVDPRRPSLRHSRRPAQRAH
jgi:hypothetical protein